MSKISFDEASDVPQAPRKISFEEADRVTPEHAAYLAAEKQKDLEYARLTGAPRRPTLPYAGTPDQNIAWRRKDGTIATKRIGKAQEDALPEIKLRQPSQPKQNFPRLVHPGEMAGMNGVRWVEGVKNPFTGENGVWVHANGDIISGENMAERIRQADRTMEPMNDNMGLRLGHRTLNKPVDDFGALIGRIPLEAGELLAPDTVTPGTADAMVRNAQDKNDSARRHASGGMERFAGDISENLSKAAISAALTQGNPYGMSALYGAMGANEEIGRAHV